MPVACAALTEGRYLTQQETLDLFGQSIDITYFDGQNFVDTTASYYRPATCETDYSDYVHSGLTGLFYVFSSSSSYNNNDYVSVRLQPQWSILDTHQIHCVLAVGTSVTQLSSAAFDAPGWVWHVAGNRVRYEAIPDNNSLYPIMQYNDGWLRYAPFVEVSHSSQTAFDCSSIEAQFTGVLSAGSVCIFIGCPYVSSDSSAATGTVATVTTGSTTETTAVSVNVTVTVDMDDTNSLLEVIIEWLEGVGNVISGLFVPPSSWYDTFRENCIDIFENAFGDNDSFEEYFSDFIAQLKTAGTTTTVHWPGLSVPTSSGSFVQLSEPADVSVIPGGTWSIPINGHTYTLIDFCKYLIDLAATVAFINTIVQKLRAVIFGTTVIESDAEQ